MLTLSPQGDTVGGTVGGLGDSVGGPVGGIVGGAGRGLGDAVGGITGGLGSGVGKIGKGVSTTVSILRSSVSRLGTKFLPKTASVRLPDFLLTQSPTRICWAVSVIQLVV